jgi:hypothetical protein
MMALMTVETTSQTRHTAVVIHVQATQTTLETQYQATQTQVMSLHPQEQGHSYNPRAPVA